MSQPTKPRLTDEEKALIATHYKVEQKDFSNLLKNLVIIHTNLLKLNVDFARTGDKAKTFDARDPNTNVVTQLVLTYKEDVKGMNRLFNARIKELGKYFRYSKTKARTTKIPTAEHLTGVHSPVLAGPALQFFFREGAANFGYEQPLLAYGFSEQVSTGQITVDQYQQVMAQLPALMSRLPYVQTGMLLRNTITMLFYIYAHAAQHPTKRDQNGQPLQGLQDPNNAQLAASDAVMNAAFGGEIPAMFYSRRLVNGKDVDKSLMSERPIEDQMNTYTNLTILHPADSMDKKRIKNIGFNPNEIHTFYFQSMAAANYVSPKVLDAETKAQFADMNVRQSMLDEHNIVARTSKQWKEILEPTRKESRKIRAKNNQAIAKAAKAADAAARAGFQQ